ncbi:heat shock factor protein 3-like isoform X1 [Sminthopsis crassicaudata]|uniref:heat shock factor protein 3-like isoform X1 n=1 Tax=Sminthopsis crassicaudata TaxID=9301 RepID=UPI003D68A461
MEGASSVVPGFLAKLWTLVDDSTTDDVIGWNPSGQSFSILDEQKFSKELLPKYFKHNNISSFIRQLNMYGFRKVAAVDNGMAEKNTAIEFQHMYFKKGEVNLLENIKRKVSAGRSEDPRGGSDDLQKNLAADVHELKEQQNGTDDTMANLKRNNNALWKELGNLRQKYNQQQQLLSKIFQFILGLMRENYILGVERKRSLPDVSGSPPSKFSRQCVSIPVESGEAVDVLEPVPPTVQDSDNITIQDISAAIDDDLIDFGVPDSTFMGSPTFSEDLPSLMDGSNSLSPLNMMPSFGLDLDMNDCPLQITDDPLEPNDIMDLPLELHPSQGIDSEDHAAMIESILNDNCMTAQNFLDRDDMQEFLNAIEANLEELQSMLSAREQIPEPDLDLLNEIPIPEFPVLNMNEAGPSSDISDTLALTRSAEEGGMTSEFGADGNKDMQLVQYMGNPLLSLFEELPSFEDRPQDARDFLLADLENEHVPTYSENSDDPLCLVAPSLSDDNENPLESFESPLLSEDPNGEYKLFPLLLLSPVASFVEEASEIENTT